MCKLGGSSHIYIYILVALARGVNILDRRIDSTTISWLQVSTVGPSFSGGSLVVRPPRAWLCVCAWLWVCFSKVHDQLPIASKSNRDSVVAAKARDGVFHDGSKASE